MLLRSWVEIEDYQGAGAFGPHFEEPRVVKASVQPTKRSALISSEGRTVRADVVVMIRPEAGPVRPESKVTLVHGAWRWRVLECEPVPDEKHPSYYEMLCATWGRAGAGPGSGSGSGAPGSGIAS